MVGVDFNPRHRARRREACIRLVAPLHRRARIIAADTLDLVERVGEIFAGGLHGVVVLDFLEVAQLVARPGGGVHHADFLALVQEEGAAPGGVEEGEHFGGLGTVGGVVGPAADDAGLVVVFEVEAVPAVEVGEMLLGNYTTEEDGRELKLKPFEGRLYRLAKA